MVLAFLCATCANRLPSVWERRTSIMLCGDIMLNGLSTKSEPLKRLGPLMKPAGACLANLEIPLTTAKSATPYKSGDDLKKRNQFVLKADPLFGPQIASVGIDLVSLGNNHCMDYRGAGLEQMLRVLASNGICYAGAGKNRELALAPAIYRTANGWRIALLSALAFVGPKALGHCTPATQERPGVAALNFGGTIGPGDKQELQDMIISAKQHSDLVIVGLHWGIERKTLPAPYQVALGRACIDAGADIVWGNHPHVLQGGELYKGKPILYSMGNLISSKNGGAGLVKLVYADTDFTRAEFFPLEIKNGCVVPTRGEAAEGAKKRFRGLCDLLRKKYPTRASEPLF